MRERLAFTMFERAGLPAPRESYCRLYVNNEYQGALHVTEEIDANFVSRVTGETDGTLFDFHWAADAQWRAEDFSAPSPITRSLLEPRTHTLDADSTLYTPFRISSGSQRARRRRWRSRQAVHRSQRAHDLYRASSSSSPTMTASWEGHRV